MGLYRQRANAIDVAVNIAARKVEQKRKAEMNIRKAAEQLAKGHGFTHSLNNVSAPTSGYMVSMAGVEESYPQIDDVDIITAMLVGYIGAHSHELMDASTYLGGWIHEGQIFIDVSECIEDEQTAIAVGRERNQIAIHNLSTGKDILL
jgi:hypothetical protein